MMERNPTDTKRAIIATLCYFDLFDYPLTLLELKRWMYASPEGSRLSLPDLSLGELSEILQQSTWLHARVHQDQGFIFLQGRDATIISRLRRAEIAERKYKRARRIASVFSRLPGVRLIAVCNTLSYANNDDASDIDFFVVTDPGRIWTTRLYTNAITASLGIRPKSHTRRDTICLSFFTTADNLNLQGLQRHPQDIYLHYWINQVVPLYDRDGTFAQFSRENQWVKTHLPFYTPYASGTNRVVSSGNQGLRNKKPTGSTRFESWSEHIQRRIMPRGLRDLANRDTRVIVSDRMLKFHDTDRREEYRQRFEERYRALVA